MVAIHSSVKMYTMINAKNNIRLAKNRGMGDNIDTGNIIVFSTYSEWGTRKEFSHLF